MTIAPLPLLYCTLQTTRLTFIFPPYFPNKLSLTSTQIRLNNGDYSTTTRRHTIKLLSSLLYLALSTVPLMAQAQAQPNGLLIIADNMGIDASICNKSGNQQAPMTNLDALCDSGLVFDNGYAAPVCSPTRATIMTQDFFAIL